MIRFLFVSGTHPDSVEIFKHSTLVNNKGNHLLSIWALVQSGWKSQLPLFLSWKQRTAVKEDADILHIEIHVTEVWAKTAKKNIETYNSTSEYGKEEFIVFTKLKRDDTIVDRIGIWN